jgi:nucleotide-binding universal stress UspA family protein
MVSPEPDSVAAGSVVVGYGESPTADVALRFAVTEAQIRRAPLVVVATYLRPVDPDLDSFDTTEAELAAQARRHAQEALQRVTPEGGAPLPAHLIVASRGLPWRVLLQRYPDAALIVVGAHHRNTLRRLLHGQTTGGELIHHSHVPVVVVPDNATSNDCSTVPSP